LVVLVIVAGSKNRVFILRFAKKENLKTPHGGAKLVTGLIPDH
jgi:hypothetical protein